MCFSVSEVKVERCWPLVSPASSSLASPSSLGLHAATLNASTQLPCATTQHRYGTVYIWSHTVGGYKQLPVCVDAVEDSHLSIASLSERLHVLVGTDVRAVKLQH